MIAALTAFEWRYQTRQLTFAVTALAFFLLGAALTLLRFGPEQVPFHSPWLVAQLTGFLSLTALFPVSTFCAHAVVRDTEHRLDEVVACTPAPRWARLAARFLGSFAALLVAFLAALAGAIVAALTPLADATRTAPLHWAAYAWALGVMAVPSLLLSASLLFAIATRTRSALACHVGAVALFGLYFAASALTDSPLLAGGTGRTAGWWAALDPFALAPYFAQTRLWSEAELRTRFVSLSGVFLINRLVTLGAAAGLFVFATRQRVPRPRPATAPVDAPLGRAALEALSPTGPTWLTVWRSSSRLEARALFRGGPVWLLLAIWAVVGAVEVLSDLRSGEYGVGRLASSATVVQSLLPLLELLGTIAVLFFTTEVAWRARVLRFADVLHATPAPRSALFAARLGALGLLIVALGAVGTVVGVLAQLAHGGAPFEAWRYVDLFVLGCWPLLLVAAAALSLHATLPQRHVALAASVALVLLTRRGFSHPLLRFAAAPVPPWSALDGHAGGLQTFAAFTFFSTLLAALFVALALRLKRLAVAAALAALLWGLWLHHARGPFESEAELAAWRADYERTWKPRVTGGQPGVEHLDFRLSFSGHVSGTLTLKNRGTAATQAVFVSTPRQVRELTLALDGAPPDEVDPRFSMHRFARALQPGERATLTFSFAFDATSVVRGFTLLPKPGYRQSVELTDARERRRQGLPPRAEAPAETDWVTFEATYDTAGDETVVATGELTGAGAAGGRRWFHFSSATPVPDVLMAASGRYVATSRMHGGVQLEVFHLPEHAENVQRVLDAAADTLDRFPPYPRPALRFAEVPATEPYGGFATAGAIFLSESRLFLADGRDPTKVDLVRRRVAHETAHQWFGVQVSPPASPGATFVIESLAKDAELQVLPQAQRAQVLAFEHDAYFQARDDTEVPLVDVTDQPWLYYSKGAVVLHAVRELLGDAPVDAALRGLLVTPEAGARDVEAALLARTPARLQPVVRDWLEGVSLYRLEVRSAKAEGGAVEVQVHAEKSSPWVDEPVVFELRDAQGEVVLRAPRVLHEGENTLRFVAPGAREVEADASLSRLQRRREALTRAIAR